MRVFACVVCLVLLGGRPAGAQSFSFGVKGGINLADQQYSGEGVDVNPDPIVDVVVGGFATIPFGGRLAFQPEALYSVKGAKFGDSGATTKIRIDYIDVPLLVRYLVTSHPVRLHAFGGPSLALRVRARAIGTFGEHSLTDDISDQIERFDYGIVAGGEIEIGRILVDGRYSWGLADADSDRTDTVKVRNRVLSVLAGFRF